MYEEPKEKKSLVQEDSIRVDIPTRRLSSFSVFFDKVHSINGLHLLSALSQIILGSFVVALSVLDIIQPVFIATVMTIVGCLTIVIGLYFVYYVLTNTDSFDSLLNKAIKRVINNQN
ncbi:MAG: hypothetical protein MI700_00120 [Balneolales bacterium]|nr:hypothetical protein [Balneolales bacterium]